MKKWKNGTISLLIKKTTNKVTDELYQDKRELKEEVKQLNK